MKHLAGLMIALLLAAHPAAAQDDPVTTDVPMTQDDMQMQAALDEAASMPLTPVFEDQEEWETFSQRVEAAIEVGRASNGTFSLLRTELAGWRDTFLTRESLNSARIATVNAQLSALGPEPEEGHEDTVDPRVTARRAMLISERSELQAPAILAAEAYIHANGLIGEIDGLIRERQAAQFTERLQSPLNPTGWGETWEAVFAALGAARLETTNQIANPSRRVAFTQQLPAILALLAVALLFLLRGRAWFTRLTGLVEARTSCGRGVARFVVSLGQVFVPLIGLFALSNALMQTGMLGWRTEAVVDKIPYYGIFPILAHWLAGHLLPKDVPVEDHPMSFQPRRSARATFHLVYFGYTLFFFFIVDTFILTNAFSPVAAANVMFPFGLLLAWPLYHLGRYMRPLEHADGPDIGGSFRATVRNFLSRGLMFSAVGGVVLAALGYASAFSGLTAPAAVTIYVIGILVLLQKLSVDAYTLVSKSDNAAQTALAPVLIGFALVLVALPILAVIWGARVTDLTEIWARFREGFSIGETRISPTSFLLFIIVFIIGYTLTRLSQAALRSTVLPRTKLDAGGQNAIVAGTGYVGIFLAALIAITTAGIDLSGLAIVAGALSVGIGFGMQNIVSNFVSGIILLIERPISQGDWIEVGGQMGYVRDISVRSTRIETFDRTDVIVPNADLVSNQVTNWTRGNLVGRAIVPVGVAYGTDTGRVTKILQEIAEAHPMVLLNPAPNVIFTGFGADSLDFEIRAILRDVNWVMQVKSDINHQIAKRFADENIEIPFAQRDLWLRNPETLQKGYRPAPSETQDATPAANTPATPASPEEGDE